MATHPEQRAERAVPGDTGREHHYGKHVQHDRGDRPGAEQKSDQDRDWCDQHGAQAPVEDRHVLAHRKLLSGCAVTGGATSAARFSSVLALCEQSPHRRAGSRRRRPARPVLGTETPWQESTSTQLISCTVVRTDSGCGSAKGMSAHRCGATLRLRIIRRAPLPALRRLSEPRAEGSGQMTCRGAAAGTGSTHRSALEPSCVDPQSHHDLGRAPRATSRTPGHVRLWPRPPPGASSARRTVAPASEHATALREPSQPAPHCRTRPDQAGDCRPRQASPALPGAHRTMRPAGARSAAAAWAACRRPSRATVAVARRHSNRPDAQQTPHELENRTA